MYIGQLIFLTELLIAEFLLLTKKKRNSFFFLRLLLSLVLCYGFVICWPVSPTSISEMIEYFVIFLITIACILFCYKITIWDCLYRCITGLIIQHGSYSIITIFAFFKEELIISLPLLIAVNLFIFFLEYKFLSNRIMDDDTKLEDHKSLLIFSFFVIGTTVFLNSFRSLYSTRTDSALNIITSIYSLLCCIFSIFLLVGFLEKMQLQNELEILNHLWHNDQKHFQASQQNMELLNLYCHDLKHLIHMIEKEGTQTDYTKKVAKEMEVYDSSITTNNRALDVILTEQSIYCKQNQITLTCMADGKQLDFIETTDLYSVFGNLIGNAIEAVMKLEDPNQRIISLIISRANNFIRIHIENYYTGHLTMVNDLPQTSKSQKAIHGYGLKSVKHMVEKYNGNLVLETVDNIFCVNIIIPIPK